MHGCTVFPAWLGSVVPGGVCHVPRARPEPWFAVLALRAAAEVTQGSCDLL